MLLTPSQCRAARAILGIEATRLADLTADHTEDKEAIGRMTVSRFENSPDNAPKGSAVLAAVLTATLEAEGVRFIRGGVVLKSAE